MPKKARPSFEGESAALAVVAYQIVEVLRARHLNDHAELQWALKALDEFRTAILTVKPKKGEANVRA